MTSRASRKKQTNFRVKKSTGRGGVSLPENERVYVYSKSTVGRGLAPAVQKTFGKKRRHQGTALRSNFMCPVGTDLPGIPQKNERIIVCKNGRSVNRPYGED